MRVEPVAGKKRGEGGGGVLRVVVSELRQRHKSCLFRLLIVGVSPQVLLQDRISTLRLPVRLRVEITGAVGTDPQQLQHPAPKVVGEDGVPVANEAAGQPMQAHHLLHENGCDLRSHHGLGCRDEVGLLRQPVHDHQSCIVVVARGKVGDLVEGDTGPRLGRVKEEG